MYSKLLSKLLNIFCSILILPKLSAPSIINAWRTFFHNFLMVILNWGGRGRTFKSCRSDQVNTIKAFAVIAAKAFSYPEIFYSHSISPNNSGQLYRLFKEHKIYFAWYSERLYEYTVYYRCNFYREGG